MGVSVGHAVRDCGGAAAKDRTADTSRFAVSYSYGVARNEAPRSPVLLRIRPECPSPAGDFAPGFVLLHPDDPPPPTEEDFKAREELEAEGYPDDEEDGSKPLDL